jgi:hypothetical protein
MHEAKVSMTYVSKYGLPSISLFRCDEAINSS